MIDKCLPVLCFECSLQKEFFKCVYWSINSFYGSETLIKFLIFNNLIYKNLHNLWAEKDGHHYKNYFNFGSMMDDFGLYLCFGSLGLHSYQTKHKMVAFLFLCCFDCRCWLSSFKILNKMYEKTYFSMNYFLLNSK